MNQNKLKEVLSIQTSSGDTFEMFSYITNYCEENKHNYITDGGNIYITKGNANIFPCVVAHTDTVHEITDNLTVIEIDGKLTGFNAQTMQQTGIGGDDKVGIFIAMQCLEHFDNIKIAFFEDEEIGCIGSYSANMDFFKDCGFVLQCDRKGNNDFVTNASCVPLCSKEFIKAITPILNCYGYGKANGLMTDVMALKETGLNVSAANISCGYYNPHSENEYVVIDDVENCLNLVISIITEYGWRSFPHSYQFKKYEYKVANYGNKVNWIDPYEEYLKSKHTIEPQFCDCCFEQTDAVTYDNNFNSYLCEKCYKYANSAIK